MPEIHKVARELVTSIMSLHSKINITEAINPKHHLTLIRHFTRAFQNTPQKRLIKLWHVVCTATNTRNEDQVLVQKNLSPEMHLSLRTTITAL